MLCRACLDLPPELRRHPGPGAPGLHGGDAVQALVCSRCGRAAGPDEDAPSFLDMLARLERAGLGVAGPLLVGPAPRPGTA